MTWAIPAIVLVVLSEVVWGPTRGIVVQGALIGSLTAMFAVGLALVYRANRIVNFAQGDLGVGPGHLRDPPGRPGRARWCARLDDRHPLPRGDRGGPRQPPSSSASSSSGRSSTGSPGRPGSS